MKFRSSTQWERLGQGVFSRSLQSNITTKVRAGCLFTACCALLLAAFYLPFMAAHYGAHLAPPNHTPRPALPLGCLPACLPAVLLFAALMPPAFAATRRPSITLRPLRLRPHSLQSKTTTKVSTGCLLPASCALLLAAVGPPASRLLPHNLGQPSRFHACRLILACWVAARLRRNLNGGKVRRRSSSSER
jgi:hypothetical protein